MDTIILFFLMWMLALPLIGIGCSSILRLRPVIAAHVASTVIGIGCVISVGLLVYSCLFHYANTFLWMSLNSLNFLLSSLIFLVSFIVHRFSIRYMDGDDLYRRFFILLPALTCSAVCMALADHFYVFFMAWFASNVFLVLLMMHKKQWLASQYAAKLAFYMLSLGGGCLFVGLSILDKSGAHSITSLSELHIPHLSWLAAILILSAACIQSALFPFHRWLISSLNSPTPVSALMHAGLVNGGGILLVKFAPLMMLHQELFIVLFLLGALSAFLGTIWKLMQHDIKKMLACSTMAQMGFMMMQCALGLFSAAIAHLCWHGLFKAYLFLSSGSSITQNKVDAKIYNNSFSLLAFSLLGGLTAVYSFACITHKVFDLSNANTFVLFFAFIAGSQLMMTWMRQYNHFLWSLVGLFVSSLCGLMYGLNIHLIENLIPSLSAVQPQPLSWLHWAVMLSFGLFWMALNLGAYHKFNHSKLGCWLYMRLFNASQPSKKMTTSLRTNYYY